MVTAESGGGLAAYSTDDALNKKDPAVQIATDGIAVRALVPNPNPQLAHYFAAVLENGRLIITDITNSQVQSLIEENVTCVAWSNKGKALIAGLKDGSAVQYMTTGKLMATVPPPPGMSAGYAGRLRGIFART